ncbi:UrcA family protein [Aurantiacibacter rhizosphaerae]|uniref:UrcA family protein n=1 Tax=Aurantiacibacter rhizosphaerae TaxID=2691582 RepID=A0A844XFQ4_9SPHN|nr:UrcA family protein [Aurantiacibacter rhizosphaerae]MWV28660.1 UrcA family protein [Aurantiacibacter rhizosphaerae]
MFTTTKGLVAATFVAALAVSSPALAQEPTVSEDGVHSLEVGYSDINLESADGQRRMKDRIRAAAKSVCGYNTHRVSVSESLGLRACVNGASDNAMTRLASATADKVTVAVRFENDTRRR